MRFVRIDGSLIGFGRAVSDGEYYASIYDVIVKPDMQGVGVGTAIMKSLLEPLQGFLFTHLTSTPGNEGFYGRLGFRKQKTAMTIMRGANSTSAQAYIHEKDL